MQRYVLGFAFTKDRQHVLLIEKQKPAWQKGFWNGLGGKIEPGETPLDAIVREFEEECGLLTNKSDWTCYVSMFSDTFECVTFCGFFDNLESAYTKETEIVKLWNLSDLTYPPLHCNLSWLIPMALDRSIYENQDYHILSGRNLEYWCQK